MVFFLEADAAGRVELEVFCRVRPVDRAGLPLEKPAARQRAPPRRVLVAVELGALQRVHLLLQVRQVDLARPPPLQALPVLAGLRLAELRLHAVARSRRLVRLLVARQPMGALAVAQGGSFGQHRIQAEHERAEQPQERVRESVLGVHLLQDCGDAVQHAVELVEVD